MNLENGFELVGRIRAVSEQFQSSTIAVFLWEIFKLTSSQLDYQFLKCFKLFIYYIICYIMVNFNYLNHYNYINWIELNLENGFELVGRIRAVSEQYKSSFLMGNL